MSKALYRKYRPKTLGDVVGQEQVTKTLERALQQGRISHAYLFVGPRGTGKTSVARIFAHEINGFQYELEDDYVDIIEIDGASNRGIDDIRELREKAAIAPSEGKFKVYIIDEVHMLTTPAFNALLKTLEEPPEHVIFIMATTDVHKVPKTILSRAQNYTFRLADAETMRGFLRKVADSEGIKIDDGALNVVVRQGGGSFRDSLSVLDQVATLSDGEITREIVVAAMGLPEEEEVRQLLEVYQSRDLGRISKVLQKILSSGIKPELLVEGMIRRILAEPRAEWLDLLERLPNVVAPFPEAKLLVALTAGCERKRATEKDVAVEPSREMNPLKKVSGGNVNNPVEKPSEQPVEKPIKVPQPVRTDFDWSEFLNRAKNLNTLVGKQLEGVGFEMVGDVLHIYPRKKVSKVILASPNNLAIVREAAGGREVVIHEVGDEGGSMVDEAGMSAEQPARKSKLDKYSEILGGKVVEDGSGDPF